MNPKQHTSSTIALLVTGVLVFGVGTYTQNGGFQLAGGLICLVAVILALRGPSRTPDDR